jgi:cellobiose transport system permease protein
VRWWTYLLVGAAAFGSLFPLYWMFIVASTDSATAT